MKLLPIEEYMKVPAEDTLTHIIFRFTGCNFKTTGRGLYSKFSCDDDSWLQYVESEHLLFYLDNKDLYKPSNGSFALPNSNPSAHDLMLRFIKERLHAEIVEIIPPKYGLKPPRDGELVVY